MVNDTVVSVFSLDALIVSAVKRRFVRLARMDDDDDDDDDDENAKVS